MCIKSDTFDDVTVFHCYFNRVTIHAYNFNVVMAFAIYHGCTSLCLLKGHVFTYGARHDSALKKKLN